MARPNPKRGSGSDQRPVARHYSFGEVAVVLGTFALCALVLDSTGLVTWANRMRVGPAQTLWLRVLTPVDRVLGRAHLDRPRTEMMAAADRWGQRWAPSVEDQAHGDGDHATASPAPLGDDGPLGHLEVARGDEVELPELADAEGPASDAGTSGPTEVTILLIGDSMMQVGLAPGIARAFAEDPHVRVLRETRVGTGLSRPDVYDWPGQLAPLIYKERPRFVVASFGGNDAQDMRRAGQIIPFGSSSWDQAYLERVQAFMEELARDGAEVLWVGLPPMRASDFNERVAKLNDIDVAASHRVKHVEFMDPASVVTGADRGFTTYLRTESGELLQVRQEDGIHLTSAGGERVAQQAVAWIKAHAISAGASALNAAEPAAPSGSPKPGG